MDISDTQLWDEVLEIVNDGENPVHYEYGVAIMYEGESTRPFRLIEVSVERDYRNNVSDVTYLRLLMGAGTRDSLLYNEREGLLLVLWRRRLGEVAEDSDGSDESSEDADDVEHFFYRGAIRDLRFGILEGETIVSSNADDADMAGQVLVDVQVYPLMIEELRFMSTGGIFKDAMVGDVLKGLATHTLAQTITTTAPVIKGVDMVESDNKEPRTRVVVPHGTPILELAEYLQTKEGGIYDHGMGSYIQDEHWYIWPLYHLKRLEKVEATLTIINITENRLPGIERTYYVKDKAVVMISTNRIKHRDTSESARSNLGKGFRYLKADRLLNEFFKLTPDGKTWKIEVDRKENVNEVVFNPTKDIHQKLGTVHITRTKQNLISNSPLGASTNPHIHSSMVAARVGSYLAVGWDNSRPELILPGMPVKYVFLIGDKPVSVEGIVVGHNYTLIPSGTGVHDKRYIAVSDLLIYVQSPEYIQELTPSIIKPNEDDPPIPNVGN